MDYKLNDYELIYMVRENDDDSRDIIYEKYYPIIKSLANEFFQQYSVYGYDYEDFLQEALVAFQKALISFDERKNVLFYSFSVLCIRRSLMSFCRNISNSKKCISNKNVVPIEEYDGIFCDVKSDLEMINNFRELEMEVQKLIVALSFESGCIFELRYNGFSYKEISILLDIPISSVEFKNRLAKRKFYRMVERFYLEKTF